MRYFVLSVRDTRSEFGIEGRKEGGNDDPLRPALNLEELEKNPPAEKLPAWIKTLSDVRKKHPAADYCRLPEHGQQLFYNKRH